MKPIILLSAAFAVIFTALPAEAQIYKWTDANGKTVVSDKPPPGQLPHQRTEVKTQNPPPAQLPQQDTEEKAKNDSPSEPNATPKEKSWTDRDLEFRQRQMERAEKEEKAKKEAAEAASKKENCDKARRRLQTFESGQRVAMLNDKGERYFVEDEQRAQDIKKTRSFIDTECK